MRPASFVCAGSLVATATAASAEEKQVISTEARAGMLVMGSERPTGGLTLGAGLRYLGPLTEKCGIYGGAGAAVVAPNDGWHWMGVLLSTEAGGWCGAGPWHLSAGLGLPVGQLPTCTSWGLCIRSNGLFPEAVARVAYRAESFRLGLEAGGMWVNTLPWSGAAIQARLVAAYR